MNISARAADKSLLYHKDATGNVICTKLHGSHPAALRAWLQQFRDATGPRHRRGYKVTVQNENLKKYICREYAAYKQPRIPHSTFDLPDIIRIRSPLRISRFVQDILSPERPDARNTGRPDYRRLANGS